MLIKIFSGLALLCCALPAWAQTAFLAPSPYVQCLTKLPGAPTAPVYPEDHLRAKEGARFEVQIEFTAPDESPRIEFAKHPYDQEYEIAVREFARKLRLPCMPAGGKPVALKQLYIFSPTDGRKSMPPQTEDAEHLARQDRVDCMKHERGLTRPTYPSRALRQLRMGKVMTRLHFENASSPPTVQHLAEIGGKEFSMAVDAHLAGMRLTCMKPDERPIAIDIFYIFRIEGEGKTVIKDMGLRQLLGIVKGAPTISVDTTTMQCPFDVRLTYLKPYTLNQVVEVETTKPERKPLLEWLRTLELDLPKKTNDNVFSDTFTLSIPCARINF